MFDAPIEDWYVWLGVAAVSVAVLGVAIGLPSATPPRATAAADAIDRVAASPAGATGSHSLRAQEIKLDSKRVSLRGRGGTAHAEVAFGPVTPARANNRLQRVLAGTPPAAVFASREEFATAVSAARERRPTWRPVPSSLEIRRVSWEGEDVLLVG